MVRQRRSCGVPRTPPCGSTASSRRASPGSWSNRRSTAPGKVEGSVKKQGYLALARQQPDLPGHRHGRRRQGRDRVHGMGDTTTRARATPRSAPAARSARSTSPAAGLGPDDGFTSYKAFVGDPPRTRWGDYGAAVTDGSSIWIASEYIAQTCTLTQYLTGRDRVVRGYAHFARELGHAREQARSVDLGSLDGRGGYEHVSAPSSGSSGRPATASTALQLIGEKDSLVRRYPRVARVSVRGGRGACERDHGHCRPIAHHSRMS